MSDTPLTDTVYEADIKLGYGSLVIVPEGYPPCDPWELARSLEKALSAANGFIYSHVADPDITTEMIEKYAEYNNALDSLTSKYNEQMK